MISSELREKIRRLRDLFVLLDETEREIGEILQSSVFPIGYEFQNKKATKQLRKNQLVTADEVEDDEYVKPLPAEMEPEEEEEEMPKERKTRKPTTCSHCGIQGHTNRTCPEKDIEAVSFPVKRSEEETNEWDDDDETPAASFKDDD